MDHNLPERRRFVRIEVPLKMDVELEKGTYSATTQNISPIGVRFQIGVEVEENVKVGIRLYIPSVKEPVQLGARVVWRRKVSLEDSAPFDVGVEITEIDDGQKNAFLKYLCDILYSSTFKPRA